MDGDIFMKRLEFMKSFEQQQSINCLLRNPWRRGTRRLARFKKTNASGKCSTVQMFHMLVRIGSGGTICSEFTDTWEIMKMA